MISAARLLAVSLIGLCTAGLAQAASVHFVHSPSQTFLRPAQQGLDIPLSPAELSVALGSLLSIERSSQQLSAASAAKVGQVSDQALLCADALLSAPLK